MDGRLLFAFIFVFVSLKYATGTHGLETIKQTYTTNPIEHSQIVSEARIFGKHSTGNKGKLWELM